VNNKMKAKPSTRSTWPSQTCSGHVSFSRRVQDFLTGRRGSRGESLTISLLPLLPPVQRFLAAV
jgi:hypothetical protein